LTVVNRQEWVSETSGAKSKTIWWVGKGKMNTVERSVQKGRRGGREAEDSTTKNVGT